MFKSFVFKTLFCVSYKKNVLLAMFLVVTGYWCYYFMVRTIFKMHEEVLTFQAVNIVHGDSGSPLTKDDQLIGIVSWGIPCGIGFPDVHTRITPYATWINGIIRESIKERCRAKVKVKGNLKVSGSIRKDSY